MPRNGHSSVAETVATAADALLSFQFQDDDDESPVVRMSHKQVEQHRRMKAKQYFEELRAMLPHGVDSRSDRNKVLSVAIDYLRELLGKTGTSTKTRSPTEFNHADDDDELMFEMDDAVKLSHNAVEQRRRHMARGYFDELRSLLPHAQAAKFDKNSVLLHTVALIRKLQAGFSTTSSDNEAEVVKGAVKSSRLEAAFGSGDEEQSCSPNDVVTFTQTNFGTASRPRSSRKRNTVKKEQSDDEEVPELEVGSLKRSRVVPNNDEEESWAFEALSLLSECAYQLSQPNTPALNPMTSTKMLEPMLSQSLPSTFVL